MSKKKKKAKKAQEKPIDEAVAEVEEVAVAPDGRDPEVSPPKKKPKKMKRKETVMKKMHKRLWWSSLRGAIPPAKGGLSNGLWTA